MKSQKSKPKKTWTRRLLSAFAYLIIAFVLLFGVTVVILNAEQDEIVQDLISTANKDFVGFVHVEDSHLSLFHEFPYISIDLEKFKVKENKSDSAQLIIDISDVFVGFDLWTILNGKMEIKKIDLDNGRIDIAQHQDGTLNIANALSTTKQVEDVEEEFHLHLEKVEMHNIELSKINEENDVLIDVLFDEAYSSFSTNPEKTIAGIDARFQLSLVMAGDTTFIKHKHFEFQTDFEYNHALEIFSIQPTTARLEGAEFDVAGSIDFKNDVNLDIVFSGNKPNFDLFLAMAPPELAPALKKYDNRGTIFFETTIKGPSANGQTPAIDARFGCQNAFFTNTEVNKKLDNLNFSGYFTNGSERNTSSMEFGLKEFSAKPEAGIFSGNLVVKNFDSPDIDLQLKSDFELNFLAKFFGLTDLYDLAGKVELTMNFKDIIDLEHPEKSIEKLNESYYTQLKVDNLIFGKESTNIPIRDIDIYAEMDGHEAKISYCHAEIGHSDIDIHGSISDLPAILHHTDDPVTAKLDISSKHLDIYELTGGDSLTSFNEKINNLSLGIHFNSSARAFTESPHLLV